MTSTDVLEQLQFLGNEENRRGMARFGINAEKAYGIKVPELKALAKPLKKNHALALDLWETGMHEARLIAIFIADPKLTTPELAENWVKDFNSWDICDQACIVLFNKTPFAHQKAKEWTLLEPEFERRAGFALMATLAVHDKKAADEKFIEFFPFLEKGSADERNFVKKAVNWAIRQIGKRNRMLNAAAIELSEKIAQQNSKSARWIAAHALRELRDEKQQARLKG